MKAAYQWDKVTAEDTVVSVLLPEQSEPLLQLFESVARQEGWQPGEQIRAHRDRSAYFAAYLHGELAGGLQIVLADADGRLPFHTVWPQAEVSSPCRAAHVAILAVRPERRGHLRLFWPLCVEMWRFCIIHDIETLVVEATPPMLARYLRLGWPLQQIGEERLHWGEPCILCRMEVQAVAGAMLMRAMRSPAFRALVGQAMRPVTASVYVEQADCIQASLMAF